MYAINNLSNQYDWCSPFSDPRLIDPRRGSAPIVLDANPVRETTFDDDMEGRNYTYNSLSDINGGDITYYYNPSLGVPFLPENFPGINATLKVDYVDPMSACKPHYYGVSARKVNDCCPLQWMRDSQSQRQDLMEKQIQIFNQNKPIYKL